MNIKKLLNIIRDIYDNDLLNYQNDNDNLSITIEKNNDFINFSLISEDTFKKIKGKISIKKINSEILIDGNVNILYSHYVGFGSINARLVCNFKENYLHGPLYYQNSDNILSVNYENGYMIDNDIILKNKENNSITTLYRKKNLFIVINKINQEHDINNFIIRGFNDNENYINSFSFDDAETYFNIIMFFKI